MKTNLTAVAVVMTATVFLAGCATGPDQRVGTSNYPATYPANTSSYGLHSAGGRMNIHELPALFF